MRRLPLRTSWLMVILMWLIAPLTAARADITPTECRNNRLDPIVVELPPDEDEVTRTITVTPVDNDTESRFWFEHYRSEPCQNALLRAEPEIPTNDAIVGRLDEVPLFNTFPIKLKTDGRSQYEVTIVMTILETEVLSPFLDNPQRRAEVARDLGLTPLEIMAKVNLAVHALSLPAVFFDGQHPDSADYPDWVYRKNFVGSAEDVSIVVREHLRFRLLGVLEEFGSLGDTENVVNPMIYVKRASRITVTIRRIPDLCYMDTDVTNVTTNGSTINYNGEVAVLSDNPTGIDLETLDELWFSNTAERQERQDRLERARQSPAMRRAMTDAQRAAHERAMAAMRAADPNPGRDAADLIEGNGGSGDVDTLQGMWTLTLQDVRFDEQGPTASSGGTEQLAMAHIANKFVLSAFLDGSSLVNASANLDRLVVPVERVGVKGPGLGLAGTNVEGCPAEAPYLSMKPCSEDRSVALKLDSEGFVCGELDAQVCNEQLELLTVSAKFLAARSFEDCIR